MRGRCLCGDIAWEGTGEGELVHHCHCGMCRKSSGTAFTTMGAFPAASFRFVRGADRVARYQTSPGGQRCFCPRCGSSVPGAPFEDRVFVPFGNLEDDPGGRPTVHIFVAHKAPWYEITDDLPRFDAYPPGYGEALSPPASVTQADPVRGSCLCGAIAYTFTGPVDAWNNCHCSRCRFARGAAHASNLFVSVERFSWTHGGDLVAAYKVPEAERFGQNFCPTCGGKVPRVNTQRGYVTIPAGSLDDDPGVRPARHIYVDSKAPWFEITGDLPRFAEMPA